VSYKDHSASYIDKRYSPPYLYKPTTTTTCKNGDGKFSPKKLQVGIYLGTSEDESDANKGTMMMMMIMMMRGDLEYALKLDRISERMRMLMIITMAGYQKM